MNGKAMCALGLLGGLMLLTTTGTAAVPTTLQYQGSLTNAAGQPVDCRDAASCPDGMLNITYRLYDAASGGQALWSETHTAVPVIQGVFTSTLGEKTALSPDLLDGPRWLGVEVGDTGELTPRQGVVSAPFAVRAGVSDDASSLGGISAVDYATLEALPELCATPEDLEAIVAGEAVGGISCEDGDTVEWDGGAWACSDHPADPDAHHSSLSAGLDITPSSVAIAGGSTQLSEGQLDLGPDADDHLDAAAVKTLTGGGNADALHTHAGAGGGGGVCYDAWGTTTCAEGFQAVLTGQGAGISGSTIFGEVKCLHSDHVPQGEWELDSWISSQGNAAQFVAAYSNDGTLYTHTNEGSVQIRLVGPPGLTEKLVLLGTLANPTSYPPTGKGAYTAVSYNSQLPCAICCK